MSVEEPRRSPTSMVTIKNDIEACSEPFVPTTSSQPVKDVNLHQEEVMQHPRRRSYRCVTIVSVSILVLMGFGVAGVLYFGTTLKRAQMQLKDSSTSTTTAVAVPEEPSVSPPTFTDPYDGSETAVGSTADDDEEFDIDGPVDSSTDDDSTSSITTTTVTSRWKLWSDEGSGSEDEDYYDSGSGDAMVI